MNLNTGYGLDSDGYIVSDVNTSKIEDIYMPCIKETIERLKTLFSQQLHSIYVYGSVARGDAVILESDLDVIAMFNEELNSNHLDKLKSLADELSKKYHALVRDVGIAVAYYNYTMDPSNYYENAFLKEMSVCVYGEDIGEQFGPYKLTPEIAIQFNGDIGEALTRTLNKLDIASGEEFKTITQNFSRKLIRTYYSMVMVRSQIWTTRLSEQSEVFIRYFPNKESVIHILLNWIDEPPLKSETVYELFRREGEWASENFKVEASMTT